MNDSDVSGIEFFPIDVEQCDWQGSQQVLMDIRRQVFIDEQGVPEAEEFGAEDNSATHWIAYGADNVPMGTARLLGDKVGRMAVLKAHRQRGVGSALMRQIIRYAAKTGLERIQLDAQLHAIPFYEGMKFATDGAIFDDVGIPHQHMSLALKHFLNPRVAPTPVDISAEERSHIALDSAEGFAQQAIVLAQRAQRQIRIFSPALDPNIFDNDELRSQLFNFARQHPYAEIHILVQNPQLLVQNGHRLLHLYHRLPSRVQMRTLKSDCKTSHTEFMLTDQAGILYKQSQNRYTGYAVYWSPLDATELANEFDTLWNASEVDPELRNLPM
ncbi:MAG: GNAT family N-acetyltransferase [Gammaproteobacteria bacterium]|nr:GNAT family N-acetyltransferase [Gammaproteobacteria bacterium]MBQ0840301.1 GNAT family N-acetyltransferase [Gammaproteobacteria bacterium]